MSFNSVYKRKYPLEHNIFSKESFIAGWFCKKRLCDKLINYYEENSILHEQGVTGTEQKKFNDKDRKDSVDLYVSQDHLGQPFLDYRSHLQDCLLSYIDKYKHVNDMNSFNVNEPYNIQKYPIGGGFKKWHFENSSAKNERRCLVFMTYLNTVEDGGTEFKYQNITSPAIKGLTLIWPAHWTHTHKGQISNTKEKIIVTGWYRFNERL
jgi:hypothetical protein|tara:strand:- start:88 stop:711 length:624 start_codon:yes stop_codon:yes gene_type:complete